MAETSSEAMCCALFIAFFDPVKGNTLEWSSCSSECSDQTALLQDVEMLVLAPGFEKTEKDFVLFQHHSLSAMFGCASFHKLSTDNAAERFARMRSVGVMGNSVDTLRKLVPFLNRLAYFANSNIHTYDVFEKTAATLFSKVPASIDTCINNLLTDPTIPEIFNNSDITTDPIDSVSQRNMCLEHSNFVAIWRAVLSGYRVLMYSKRNAGLLCDLSVDLMHSGGDKTSRPLLFRTFDYKYATNVQVRSKPTWFAATTDMRLVLGLGMTELCWDILIDFDDVISGTEIQQGMKKIKIDSKTLHSQGTCSQRDLSSFRIHMTENCDSRVRLSLLKGNDTMWFYAHNNIPIQDQKLSLVDERLSQLALWLDKLQVEFKNIATVEEMHNSKKLKNAIKLLIKLYAISSTHIPWIIHLCKMNGVDASCLSSFDLIKLRVYLLIKNRNRNINDGKVVPIIN